jgi:hypothetical protein
MEFSFFPAAVMVFRKILLLAAGCIKMLMEWRFVSTDGEQLFNDKNVITGLDGGTLRVSGGLAVLFDGYSQLTAVNGEPYSGAFRSDEIHIMVEQDDSIMVANGEITEPKFDITVEAGSGTGVFGTTGYKMRSVSPNFVRNPKYWGNGIICTSWVTQGMGIGGSIEQAMFVNCNGTFIGNRGTIDAAGNIVMTCSFFPFSRNKKLASR